MSIDSLHRAANRAPFQAVLLLLRSTSGCPKLPPFSHKSLGPFLDLRVFKMWYRAGEEWMKGLDILSYKGCQHDVEKSNDR